METTRTVPKASMPTREKTISMMKMKMTRRTMMRRRSSMPRMQSSMILLMSKAFRLERIYLLVSSRHILMMLGSNCRRLSC